MGYILDFDIHTLKSHFIFALVVSSLKSTYKFRPTLFSHVKLCNFYYPVNIYLFKLNSRNTVEGRSVFFIVNF